MDYEKVLGERLIPTYEELKSGLLRLIDEGKISREDAARVLPELRESEDERINKAIFKALSKKEARDVLLAEGVQVSEALAWLEKHKEISESKAYEILSEKGFVIIEREAYNELCDKAEQKMAPDDLQKSFEAGQMSIVDNPEQYGLCKKQEWSEEDKLTVDSAIFWLERRLFLEHAEDISTDSCPLSMRKTIERLKSLL